MLIEVICLLLLSCNVTVVEYTNQFYPVLYATENGRKKVFHCKILYSAIAGVSVNLLFSICNYILYKNLYVLPGKNSPAACIETFIKTEFSISLIHIYWLAAFYRRLLGQLFVC